MISNHPKSPKISQTAFSKRTVFGVNMILPLLHPRPDYLNHKATVTPKPATLCYAQERINRLQNRTSSIHHTLSNNCHSTRPVRTQNTQTCPTKRAQSIPSRAASRIPRKLRPSTAHIVTQRKFLSRRTSLQVRAEHHRDLRGVEGC